METKILTAKELADKLLEHPDFKVVFRMSEEGLSRYGIDIREFSVDISDIRYSDSIIILGGDEQE